MTMRHEEMVSTVASSLGLDKRLVDRAYRAYWKAVRWHIKSLPLKEDLTEEEFQRLQPNVNIPSIGKLYVTLDRYKRIKKRHNMLLCYNNKQNKETENKK